MTVKVGRLGMVYLQGAGSSPQYLGTARSWSFRMDTDLIETSTFGAAWKTWLPLPVKWEGSVEGNFDDASTIPFDAIQNAMFAGGYSPRQIVMYPDRNNVLRFYTGNIWPKLAVEFNMRGVARYTLDFTGDGALNVF